MCPSCPVLASTMIAPQPAKTSANVPTNSAASRRASAGEGEGTDTPGLVHVDAVRLLVGEELADERPHPPVDLVPDPAHRRDVLARRVVELPVLVALARVDRAGIAATHRDHNV